MKKYKYSDVTGKIIGCAIEVHNVLGNGFQEKIYQRALRYEREKAGLKFAEEFGCLSNIKKSNWELVEWIFLWRNKVSVELKAVLELESAHIAQAMNYMEAIFRD